MNSEQSIARLHHREHQFDVCVIGGGMAGLCAAIAAARNGATTALLHDRPVLGGNASSEVRMWICGAPGKYQKETGILEEIQLDNLYLNPSLNYSIWDSVLWGKAHFQPGLQLFLNTSCLAAATKDNVIESVTGWQLTSQTMQTVSARQFIDCSGDSILAALTPALCRSGREAGSEFDEDIEPELADNKTMGNSLLIQLRRTDSEQRFVPPPWAYKFLRAEDLPRRMDGVQGSNFWWIEVGGLDDTISDAESIRDELMKVVYGVWDYIKNRADQRATSANWAIEFIGSVPGKRENRRYEGDHILTQNDVRAGGMFGDIVAFGGWPMDDHHPAGIYYRGAPTIFHAAPSPYGIPLRCLYSKNMDNLWFAGRNISVTHAALSSTRVMATCAILGQAAGSAAGQCALSGRSARSMSQGEPLARLQRTLQDDDCWLPGLKRPVLQLAAQARLEGDGENIELLRDGVERCLEDGDHAWLAAQGQWACFAWHAPVKLEGVRLVFDSNLQNDKRMPCSYPQKGDACRMPPSLVRSFRLEALDGAEGWRVVHRDVENCRRLVWVDLPLVTSALKLVIESSWGDEVVRVFAFEPLQHYAAKYLPVIQGEDFELARSRIAPEDLTAPHSAEPAGQPRHSA